MDSLFQALRCTCDLSPGTAKLFGAATPGPWLGPVPRPCPRDTSTPAVIKRDAKLVRRTMGLDSKHCGMLIIAALLGTAKAQSSSAGPTFTNYATLRGSNASLSGGQCDPSGICVKVPMSTPWTYSVNLSNPWPEYPRPQMVRSRWQSLNGIWEFQSYGCVSSTCRRSIANCHMLLLLGTSRYFKDR